MNRLARISLAITMVVPLALAAPTVTTLAAPHDASAKHYQNCTKLNKDYKHGVGKPSAHDHTSGTPVTNFYKSNSLYNANSDKDRDGDKIACEKR